MVSPMKAASPTTYVMQAGVWPGVAITRAVKPPIWNFSPSANIRSNCRPSDAKSEPRL